MTNPDVSRDIPVEDAGLTAGFGLFETLEVCDRVPLHLGLHIRRLTASARELFRQPVPSPGDLTGAVLRYVAEEAPSRCALRFSVTHGNPVLGLPPRLFISHRPHPYGPHLYRDGITAVPAPFPKNEYSPIVGHKTFNQLENLLAMESIRRRDGDTARECLFLNTAGHLAEGGKSNIFFVYRGQLHTPAPECGLLPGITRGIVIGLLKEAGVPLKQGCYSPELLYRGEEAFCTNSLMGVMPLVKVGEKVIGTGRPGALTRRVGELYRRFTAEAGGAP